MAAGDKKPVVMTGDIDNTVAAKLHAAQHASGGSDPVTPASIGALGFKRILTSADDLDTLFELGLYAFATGNVPANSPYTNASIVEVIQLDIADSRMIQRVTRYGASGHTSFRVISASTGWTAWAELATTDYAVNKAGDTMTGALTFNNKSAFHAIQKTRTVDDNDYRITLGIGAYKTLVAELYNDTESTTQYLSRLELSPTAMAAQFGYGNSGVTFLHTGHKPTGSYTGNGDATERTIETGGIGQVIAIRSVNGFALIVGGAGGLTRGPSDGLASIASVEAAFDGSLTIKTDNAKLNASGVTYAYQVL